MKKIISITLIVLLGLSLSGCDVIDGIINYGGNSESSHQGADNGENSSASSNLAVVSKEKTSKPTQNTASKNQQVGNNGNSSVIASNTTTSSSSNKSEPHEHLFTVKNVKATCSEGGYTIRKCSCGYKYTSNETPKNYQHKFSKNSYPVSEYSDPKNSLGSDKCSLCGLEVKEQGFWKNERYIKSSVRYYFTEDTFVVYGSGTIPKNINDSSNYSSNYNPAPWYTYFKTNSRAADDITKIIIADGIIEISDNSFKFPKNNVQTIYISDSVTKIGNSFSGFEKITEFRMSHNLEYLGENFSSPDDSTLMKRPVLPATLKYFSRKAFYYWNTICYEGTERQFEKIETAEQPGVPIIKWIKQNQKSNSKGIKRIRYEQPFE